MRDPLADIRQYSPTLTIGQVVKFCEKKGLGLTRAMIQNYIRDGLVPPPVNKRVYTHRHLAALALIDDLKTVFSMEDIKAAIGPLMADDGLPLETYRQLVEKRGEAAAKWKAEMAAVFSNPDGTETARVALMAHLADVKALACERLREGK